MKFGLNFIEDTNLNMYISEVLWKRKIPLSGKQLGWPLLLHQDIKFFLLQHLLTQSGYQSCRVFEIWWNRGKNVSDPSCDIGLRASLVLYWLIESALWSILCTNFKTKKKRFKKNGICCGINMHLKGKFYPFTYLIYVLTQSLSPK